ncbi:MAG TPA: phosphate signaling complex protein PhoU [bacterium]|nr:phosphate signaling complex protein PhoU [bacterium]HQG45358.1 phosphate signaling complex protein PhoU [bacterium]HQI50351.1 phosphate signaling complex protein PhoU [bacterium]HQJ63419.1 phosphate signaling complex protein PhoU [bacterium]
MTLYNESHYEKSLRQDMELLQKKTLEMAILAEGGLRNAITALQTRDQQLAYTVILRDRFVDSLETELDRLCLEFIVRQQPVASHLRFVFATIKIIRELERIGDYAESIARQVLTIMNIKPLPPLDDFIALSDIAIAMFHDGVQAFLTHDVEWARQLMIQEDIADEMRNRINTQLIEAEEQGELAIEALAPLMTVARRLERTTDQAKNICEEIIYMSTGESIKHRPAEIFRILFVDEANDLLSQMAEAVGRAQAEQHLAFSSAGLTPAREIRPQLRAFMAGKNISMEGYQPKDLAQFLDTLPVDVIVALNPDVHRRIPSYLANCVVFEWSIPELDPAAGSDADLLARYEEAFGRISRQVHDLVQAIIGHDEFHPGQPARA